MCFHRTGVVASGAFCTITPWSMHAHVGLLRWCSGFLSPTSAHAVSTTRWASAQMVRREFFSNTRRPRGMSCDTGGTPCRAFQRRPGHAAFLGETVSDALVGILDRAPDWPAPPRNTPSLIVRLLRRCLHKERRTDCAVSGMRGSSCGSASPRHPTPWSRVAPGVRSRVSRGANVTEAAAAWRRAVARPVSDTE